MKNIAVKREKAIARELFLVKKQEQRMERAARNAKPSGWKELLTDKIPSGVQSNLEAAFCKGFSLVFAQGKSVIEKGFRKEELQADHKIRAYAVQVKGGRRELKQLRKSANRSGFFNLATTTVEGIGLGALGIGLPDIVLFLGTLLKGIYETALNFGFSYETPQEQLLILKMMAAALSTGEDWDRRNREVEERLRLETVEVPDAAIQEQMKETASVFAMDMLLLKFIQGLPVVGILGGAANPVYYDKVMKYIQVKYRKRYLLDLQSRGNEL